MRGGRGRGRDKHTHVHKGGKNRDGDGKREGEGGRWRVDSENAISDILTSKLNTTKPCGLHCQCLDIQETVPVSL